MKIIFNNASAITTDTSRVIDCIGIPPRWSSPCRGEGAYPLRSSNQSASTRKAQLSVAAKVVRPTVLLNHVKTRLESP